MVNYLQKEDTDYLLKEDGDKIITGAPLETWVFVETGNGVEALLIDKVLILVDSGSGVEHLSVDKVLLIIDSGSGVEAYYKVYPYPTNLKRTIIYVRDRK